MQWVRNIRKLWHGRVICSFLVCIERIPASRPDGQMRAKSVRVRERGKYGKALYFHLQHSAHCVCVHASSYVCITMFPAGVQKETFKSKKINVCIPSTVLLLLWFINHFPLKMHRNSPVGGRWEVQMERDEWAGSEGVERVMTGIECVQSYWWTMG